MSIGSSPEITQYLDHLLKNDRFRRSPSLNHLLEYLVRKAIDGKVDEIKESIIAIDVFGRSHEFDGRLDNIVRVQAHRLRKTLETHYAAEGLHDRFVISIPKGSYIPIIQSRDEAPLPVVEPPLETIADVSPLEVCPPVERPVVPRRSFQWPALAAVFVAGAAIAVAATLTLAPSLKGRADGVPDGTKAPLSALWSSFLQPGVNCVVSFTNPVFLWSRSPHGRVFTYYTGPLSAPVGSQVDIHTTDPYIDPEMLKPGRPLFFGEAWTGTGEVLGIYRLTKLFTEAGHSLKVVRSRALSFPDLRDVNVVFLGSPWANDLQDKINPGRTPLECRSGGKIVNFEPRAGEEPTYQAVVDSSTNALKATYSLISVLPGVSPGTRYISSAGLDTYGTSAGIDFLTSPQGVSDLLQEFDPQQHRKLPDYFQALIRTDIIRNDVARTSVVLVREVDRKALLSKAR